MSDATIDTRTQDTEAGFGDYVSLLKPRVMSLAVFTALVGLLAAPVSLHPMEVVASIIFIAVGAGASGALNMWRDADIDAAMRRTAKRPVPSGKVDAGDALAIGVALSGLSVAMLALSANLLAAGLLAFAIFYYAVVYTMWLKRRTPQNIVIGGAAGAFPPIIGWAAATGGVSVEPILMFALIFLWTPPHFWALALFARSDYQAAKVPMLTVTHGPRAARNRILAYALLMVPAAMGLGFASVGGPLYLAVSLAMNALFLKAAFETWRRDEVAAAADGYRKEKCLFRLSLWHLFVHFGALLAEAGLRSVGLGGW